MTKTLYFDCLAGASGDMLLGALLDLGVPIEAVEQELHKLTLPEYRLEVRRVSKNGIWATKVDVRVGGQLADSQYTEVIPGHHHGHHHGHSHDHHDHGHNHDHRDHAANQHQHRPLRVILDLLDRSDLTPPVRELARRIFIRLGQAESRVHGVPLEDVHFHEVGGTDAIVDIVGASAALHALGVDRVVVSPVHLGSGFVKMAHGLYPIPAPATAYLLEGAPVYQTEVKGELCTPTGAAILREVATAFGPIPGMVVSKVGYGAGTKDREIPNVLRVLLGTETGVGSATEETVTELMANIDDMNPQFYEFIMQRLFECGALDVWMVPVYMKKNRPGVVLHVLAHPERTDELTQIVLTESTTIGVRRRQLERTALSRAHVTVQTEWGPVRVKVARYEGRVLNAAPEYEECRVLAEKNGVPVKLVHAAAGQAAAAALK